MPKKHSPKPKSSSKKPKHRSSTASAQRVGAVQVSLGDPVSLAIQREAALAAEHLATGVSALSNANYASPGCYSQAFFALTIGMERASKLALIVHHAIMNCGAFPSEKAIRQYGHNLRHILDEVDRLASTLASDADNIRLPREPIHAHIIDILSAFAKNVTRYYNVDVITKGKHSVRAGDPIADWYERVILGVFKDHVSKQRKAKIRENAEMVHAMTSGTVCVLMTSESGREIDSVFEASYRTGIQDAAAPYTRMYVLQVCRFLARVLSHLGYEAQRRGLATIPCLADFFVIFNNDDKYFRTRKRWSIYRL